MASEYVFYITLSAGFRHPLAGVKVKAPLSWGYSSKHGWQPDVTADSAKLNNTGRNSYQEVDEEFSASPPP